MTRRLVVTADDLGIDEATIDAVAGLARARRVSAASIIPMAAWAGPAADRLKEYATAQAGLLSLGLHATFTAQPPGGSWGPLTSAASLVREGTRQFHAEVSTFAAAADAGEVRAELEAQLAWLGAAGVPPTHLDAHHGAIYGIDGPHFLHVAVQVCAAHGLALRLPRIVPEEFGAVRHATRLYHRAAVALADDLEVRLPETLATDWRPPEQIAGYRDLRETYLRKIGELPEGLSELILHPTADTTAGGRQLVDHAKRRWELRFLNDDAFADALGREGVEVVTWHPRVAAGA